MEGQFESDKQSILTPAAYSPGESYPYPNQQHVQQPPSSQTVVHVALQQPPPDYLVFSILVTIFCCLPFGIVALVKSSQVRTFAALGDMDGAMISSAQAKKWCYAALFTGMGIIVFFFVFYFILFLVAL